VPVSSRKLPPTERSLLFALRAPEMTERLAVTFSGVLILTTAAPLALLIIRLCRGAVE